MNQALATGAPNDWLTRDKLVRVLVIAGFFILEASIVRGIVTSIRATASFGPLQLTRLMATACLFLFIAMMMWLTMVRDVPRLQAPGSRPRIAALAGSNLILLGAFFIPAHAQMDVYASVISSVLILTSNVLSVLVLRRLGRSFSIMAEARALVTDGPYALVRHPLYLVEEIGVIGTFIQLASWPAAALFLLHFGFQVQRMRNEERVLTQAFPNAYRDYAAKTARLIPHIW